jgi:hypothetical protein
MPLREKRVAEQADTLYPIVRANCIRMKLWTTVRKFMRYKRASNCSLCLTETIKPLLLFLFHTSSSASHFSNMITPLQTSFGNFQGTQGDGVVQFRGVKYACLKDQLSVPEMVTSYRDELVDATEFG